MYHTSTNDNKSANSSSNAMYRFVQVDSAQQEQQCSTGIESQPVQLVVNQNDKNMLTIPSISVGQELKLHAVDTPTGLCYLLNPQDMCSSTDDKQSTMATFIPLSRLANSSEVPFVPASSNVKRRASHNEVEKRRRDKINQWINRLARLLPDEEDDETSRQMQSKGGILAKTVTFIQHLKDTNKQLVERHAFARELGQICEENDRLKRILKEAGISASVGKSSSKRAKIE